MLFAKGAQQCFAARQSDIIEFVGVYAQGDDMYGTAQPIEGRVHRFRRGHPCARRPDVSNEVIGRTTAQYLFQVFDAGERLSSDDAQFKRAGKAASIAWPRRKPPTFSM